MREDVGTTKRGSLSVRRKLGIWEREKGLCMLCNTRLIPGKFIYEHVKALELGGEDIDSNIRLTCVNCATEKTKADQKLLCRSVRAANGNEN